MVKGILIGLGGAIALAALIVGIVLAVQPPKPRSPLPPESASVAVVTSAYLHGATTGDCGMTAALTKRSGDDLIWCRNPRMIAAWAIQKPYAVDDGSGEVCVDFMMRNTAMSGLDAGDNPWNLCFTKTSDGWRVDEQGPNG